MTGVPDNEELGRRVRLLRAERRLTLKQVEQASGLSATHLSEIERGRTSPTLGALARIARALGRDASYFVEDRELAEVSYVPREESAGFVAGGARLEGLSRGIPGGRLFAYRLRLDGAEFLPGGDGGEAFYLVRSGTVEAAFDGDRVRLGAGDAAQGPAGREHRLAAVDGPAEVIALFTWRVGEEP